MSADRWSECPRCSQKLEASKESRIEALRQHIAERYGKLPMDEFAAEQERTNVEILKITSEVIDCMFREDYYFTLCNDRVSVDYKGSCETCGTSIRIQKDFALPGMGIPVDYTDGVAKNHD